MPVGVSVRMGRLQSCLVFHRKTNVIHWLGQRSASKKISPAAQNNNNNKLSASSAPWSDPAQRSFALSNSWICTRPLENLLIHQQKRTIFTTPRRYIFRCLAPARTLKTNYKSYEFTLNSLELHSHGQGAKYLAARNFTGGNKTTTKMAKIISGKEVADEIRAKLKSQVETMSVKPKLVIVQVGGREDSNVYIRMKIQFAESIGATAELVKLGRDVSEHELAEKIHQLNKDTTVHGIITQLPFDCSNKINSDYIVNLIDPKKDVDGLSVYNAGKLSHGELDSSSFIPCTPNGSLELIRKSGIQVEGSRSVVIGRSKIVGSPMAQLLLWHHSTVTICHSKTKNLDEICRQADILVAAVGRAQMVKKSWLKPGAVVIDCGINVIPDASKKSGTRLVGDVDFEDCKDVAGAITPVPGGVGPMTVAMLISNTVEAARRASSTSE